MKYYRPKLNKASEKIFAGRKILVIGDLHEPFTRSDYFDFCVDIQKKWRTTHTIFIGDVIFFK